MSKIELLVSDEQIEDAFKGTNFGDNYDNTPSKRCLIGQCLLKLNCGYNDGHTIKQICRELNLVTSKFNLNKKGKEFLFRCYYD